MRVNRRCGPVLVLAAVLFGAHQMAAAQSISTVPQITVHQLGEGERPLIDGRVDDMSWSSTESFSGFVQQEPDDGEPATERTEIRFHGFFLVYNDRRDTSPFTPDELLGRSFIVKYTRLFDY